MFGSQIAGSAIILGENKKTKAKQLTEWTYWAKL